MEEADSDGLARSLEDPTRAGVGARAEFRDQFWWSCDLLRDHGLRREGRLGCRCCGASVELVEHAGGRNASDVATVRLARPNSQPDDEEDDAAEAGDCLGMCTRRRSTFSTESVFGGRLCLLLATIFASCLCSRVVGVSRCLLPTQRD